MKLTKERLVQIIKEEMNFYEEDTPPPSPETPVAPTPEQPEVETDKIDSAVDFTMKTVSTKILNAKQYSQFLQKIMKYNADGKISDAQKLTVLRNLRDLLLGMVGGKESLSQ